MCYWGYFSVNELIMHQNQKSKEELLKEIEELQRKFNSLELCVKEDGKARMLTEEALRISEERYDLAMEASHDGIFDWNLETNAIYYSPGWKKMLGYEDHELPNDFSVWEKTTLAEDVEKSWKLQQKVISGEVDRFVTEFKMRHKDGHWVDILSRANAVFNKNGKAVRMVGTHTDISLRKKAEIKLRDEKEQIRTILDLFDDPIFVKDDNHRITLANNAFYKIFDLNKKEVIGLTLAESVPENERKAFLEVDRRVLDTGIEDLREEKLTIGGVTKIIITRKTRFIDESGNIFLVGSIHDITEHKLAQEALLKSEDRLNLALETGFIGAFDLNLVDDSTYHTLIHDQIFGYETIVPDWTFETFLSHVFCEDRSYVEKNLHKAIDSFTDLKFECRIKRVDGDLRWISVMAKHKLNFEGEPIYLSGIVQDITEQKLTEIELIKAKESAEENEEKFKVYTQDSPIAIYTTDEKGNCIYVNNKWLEFAGISFEESLGMGWVKSIHPDDKKFVIENWNKSVQLDGDWFFEYRFLTPSGKVTCVEGSAKRMYSKDNKLIGYLGSNVDITDRKKVEFLLIEKNEELKIAKEKAEESDRLKSAFLANMSHEIRTPMNSILGFSELLKEPNLTGAKQQRYVRIIMKSGERMLNIIDDIVDISKIEAGLMVVDIEPVNVNEKIDYIYAFFKPETDRKGIKLVAKKGLSFKEATIRTDNEKLFAIITNLVKNSIKYSEKGVIELGYELVREAEGKVLQFFVKDTGIGILVDRQEAIFERFIQADIVDTMVREGAGLGLAISKSYVEMLGGKIWVESEVGKGSNFYFSLPYDIESPVTGFSSL